MDYIGYYKTDFILKKQFELMDLAFNDFYYIKDKFSENMEKIDYQIKVQK